MTTEIQFTQHDEFIVKASQAFIADKGVSWAFDSDEYISLQTELCSMAQDGTIASLLEFRQKAMEAMSFSLPLILAKTNITDKKHEHQADFYFNIMFNVSQALCVVADINTERQAIVSIGYCMRWKSLPHDSLRWIVLDLFRRAEKAVEEAVSMDLFQYKDDETLNAWRGFVNHIENGEQAANMDAEASADIMKSWLNKK